MVGIEAARMFVDTRFSDCIAALLFGSVARGEESDRSDLDVLVVMPDETQSYRQSFHEYGWNIEVWVVSTGYATSKIQRPDGNQCPVTLTAYAEGLVLKDRDEFVQSLMEKASGILEEGPPPLTSRDIDTYRYMLTDWLDDFLDTTEHNEAVMISHALMVKSAEFLLAFHGRWIEVDRWMFRALKNFDHPLAAIHLDRLTEFYRSGEKDDLARHVEAIMALAGGKLYAGYHQTLDR